MAKFVGAEPQVAILLPQSLVERVAGQWANMHRDPTVAAIAPRFTKAGAVRVALHLALQQLEAEEEEWDEGEADEGE